MMYPCAGIGRWNAPEREIEMKMVKVRETVMAIVAIAIIVVIAAVASVVFGLNIPILRDIAGFLGING